MTKLERLQKCTTKPSFAKLLKVPPSFLTHILYVLKPDTQYITFTIPKKNGGVRTIKAPSSKLKSLQSNLSNLLLDCIDEINESKQIKKVTYKRVLSHGFVRECSIMTNALCNYSA